jgi:protein SCO1/2/putative membrane protein
VRIVVATVFVSAIVVLAAMLWAPASPARAGQDLGDSGYSLGEFELTERSGRVVKSSELADRVWVGSFIFTRCPLSCPKITGVMKGIEPRLRRANIALVSLTVDPAHDTPAVLTDYADRFGAPSEGWLFLTGEPARIRELVRDRFHLPIAESTPADMAQGAEAVTHSDRLVLVNRGRIVGYFDSSDVAAVESLVSLAGRLAQPAWVRALPTVNATLNGLCACLLVAGWLFISRRPPVASRRDGDAGVSGSHSLLDQPRVRAHALCMALAVITSAVFLTCYLIYHYNAGSMPFQGSGGWRWSYFTILLSHTLLATFGVVPLVTLTLVRALTRDFARHSRIAQVTFPIWLYVSITGVVIYLMLYHLPVAVSSGS